MSFWSILALVVCNHVRTDVFEDHSPNHKLTLKVGSFACLTRSRLVYEFESARLSLKGLISKSFAVISKYPITYKVFRYHKRALSVGAFNVMERLMIYF